MISQQQMNVLAHSLGREGQHIIGEEFQAYTPGRPSAALSAAASATQTFQIRSDSDFVIEKTTYFADNAGAAQTVSTRIVPNVSAQIIVTTSGRQLFNVQAPIPTLFGTGELPFIWPKPYIVPASSTVQIQLTSFEASNPLYITLVFAGRVLYWSK